jgi:hypothetical protein
VRVHSVPILLPVCVCFPSIVLFPLEEVEDPPICAMMRRVVHAELMSISSSSDDGGREVSSVMIGKDSPMLKGVWVSQNNAIAVKQREDARSTRYTRVEMSKCDNCVRFICPGASP